jgi:hypothetical protein
MSIDDGGQPSVALVCPRARIVRNINLENRMNKLLVVSAVVVSSLAFSFALATPAAAAPPAWCKGVTEPANLSKLSSTDLKDMLREYVRAVCVPSPDAEHHRGEIEATRQAWTKRLGMIESDWADVAAYVPIRYDHSIRVDPATDVLAAAAPIDQYATIMRVVDLPREPYDKLDTLYATDMFESNLSQIGRFAFLNTTCFDKDRYPALDNDGMLGTEVSWAICQADFERFDLAKFFEEVRAAKADGAVKMMLRVAAFDLPRRMKDHAADVQAMLKRHDATRKVFEVAAQARAEWASGIGKNTRLLELVLAMDSARLAQSRKQLEGCGENTAAALAEAVATVPARAFPAVYDDRDNPRAGFASAAGLVLMQSAAVNLASIAYAQCAPESGIGGFLKDSLANGPGFRGPRNAALSAIKGAKIVYDKMSVTLRFPEARPYGRAYPEGRVSVSSHGGVVAAVKRKGELLSARLEQRLIKFEQCVKSHSTGRIQQIRGDGSVVYERVCDKSGTTVQDQTEKDFELEAKYASWIKPGARFSAIEKDVIAVWPSKNAKAPSMVLGGAVK